MTKANALDHMTRTGVMAAGVALTAMIISLVVTSAAIAAPVWLMSEEARAEATAQDKAVARTLAAQNLRDLAGEIDRQAKAAAAAEREAALAHEAALRQEAVSDPKAYAAQAALATFGWGADQMACLDSLWIKESNWDYTAQNPSSGAYGIPQSLPGEKMASAGSDWATNPATQIDWGLGYIAEVYGSPCSAWGHSQSVGWY